MTMRYAEVSQKALKFLDFTSLTVEEFGQLVPVFEENYERRMKYVRLDGKPRTGRSYQTYSNCPLATPEDRLLFILVYLKTNNLQVVQGELFGMPQNKANQWIHTLLPVLQTTMRDLGETPARSLAELAELLDQSVLSDLKPFTPDKYGKAADGLPQISDEVKQEKHEDTSPPLFAMMGPNDVSSVRKTRMNRKTIIAARKKVTP